MKTEVKKIFFVSVECFSTEGVLGSSFEFLQRGHNLMGIGIELEERLEWVCQLK